MFCKLFNLLGTLRIKSFPYVNRMILKTHEVTFGKNICIPGKVSWVIRGGQNFHWG